MKLIQMLALAAALAMMAAAQNTGATGGPQAAKSPTPGTTTPSTGNAQPASGKAAAGTKRAPIVVGQTAAAQAGTKAATGQAAANTKGATKAPAGTAATNAKGGTKSAAGTAAAGAQSGIKAAAGTTGSAKPGPKGPPSKAPVSVGTLPSKASKATAKGPIQNTKTKKAAAVKPPKPVIPAKVTPPAAKTPVAAPVVAEKKPAPRLGPNGRRDPFVSPIRAITSGGPGASCTTGKRCLAIPEVVLQGTVKDISGKMMAVVVTSAHRTYTLRENDQVFNGSVEKITTDSIIFREFVKDALGRETAREVVKKLGPAS
jgi:hypothetical protein